MSLRFKNRQAAGRMLARHLMSYADRSDVVVLALPRGGVPVAFEVASALRVPLDVFLVRKLGVPGHEELAMGAIAPGARVVNWETVRALQIRQEELESVIESEERELHRREQLYRGAAAPLSVAGRTVVLIDDGLATGSTMRVAVKALREQRAARIVVAAPVGAPSSCDALAGEVDDVVCVQTPEPFQAVGLWYEDFSQTSDDDVRALLAAARERQQTEHAAAP